MDRDQSDFTGSTSVSSSELREDDSIPKKTRKSSKKTAPGLKSADSSSGDADVSAVDNDRSTQSIQNSRQTFANSAPATLNENLKRVRRKIGDHTKDNKVLQERNRKQGYQSENSKSTIKTVGLVTLAPGNKGKFLCKLVFTRHCRCPSKVQVMS
ncbi:hypothetical protein EVAR_87316_1 [Eumeta japonica]|uniref:Uncharacterized protein n=1 Tax=Eumeta variegata TaxID=151549 RepID=A0A4C1VUR0_EUMVA|nr:hypothetical protein EVAR_87316_1 [Eumeta japonica]